MSRGLYIKATQLETSLRNLREAQKEYMKVRNSKDKALREEKGKMVAKMAKEADIVLENVNL